MFTGLVEGTAPIVSAEIDGPGMTLVLDLGGLAEGVRLGDSIAIAGCCLTVVAIDGNLCSFEIGSESLSKTNFGNASLGMRFNIERSLKVGDRLGGHFVTGHVDAIATVVDRRDEGEWSHFRIQTTPQLLSQVVSKGSITVDGVSLTVVEAGTDSFTLALIPHTLQATTLGGLQAGDTVHLETDILAKYVQRSALS